MAYVPPHRRGKGAATLEPASAPPPPPPRQSQKPPREPGRAKPPPDAGGGGEPYAEESRLFRLHVRNDALHKLIIEDYGFYTGDGAFVALDSNINVYEGLFLSQLLELHIQSAAPRAPYAVLEIGCAYGTSSMMLANVLNRHRRARALRYDIIDPYQKTQWRSHGLANLERIKAEGYEYTLHEQTSDVALAALLAARGGGGGGAKFDLIFIDGGHGYDIVRGDIEASLALLRDATSLVVCDDVQHKGVRRAVADLAPRLRKVRVRGGAIVADDAPLYAGAKRDKRDIDDPWTMFAFRAAARAPDAAAPPAPAGGPTPEPGDDGRGASTGTPPVESATAPPPAVCDDGS